MNKELWYKVLESEEYRIARSAWGFFLKAHGDECDMDGAIDTIAGGVLEIANNVSISDSNGTRVLALEP